MMKALIPFLLAATAGAAALPGAQAAEKKHASPMQRQQARVEEELSLLTPQKTVNCIDTRFRTYALYAIGDKLIYREGRNRIYVSDTNGGCEGVAKGDTLVTRQFGTRLCRGDIANTVDRASHFPTGSCAIGTFTPYTKG